MVAMIERPTESCIVMLRPQGIEPVITGVLWPEDQTAGAAFIIWASERLNPGLVVRTIEFPEGATRADAQEFLGKVSNQWLRDLYQRPDDLTAPPDEDPVDAS